MKHTSMTVISTKLSRRHHGVLLSVQYAVRWKMTSKGEVEKESPFNLRHRETDAFGTLGFQFRFIFLYFTSYFFDASDSSCTFPVDFSSHVSLTNTALQWKVLALTRWAVRVSEKFHFPPRHMMTKWRIKAMFAMAVVHYEDYVH